MKGFSKHFPHYFPLLGIFIFGILAFMVFSYDKNFQMVVAAAVAVSYVFWGIVHHIVHKDLYLSVVFEYIAVAFLGLVIVFSLLIRT